MDRRGPRAGFSRACPGDSAFANIGLQVDASTTASWRINAVPGWPSVMLRRSFSFGM
jgi:hypothetical protein